MTFAYLTLNKQRQNIIYFFVSKFSVYVIIKLNTNKSYKLPVRKLHTLGGQKKLSIVSTYMKAFHLS